MEFTAKEWKVWSILSTEPDHNKEQQSAEMCSHLNRSQFQCKIRLYKTSKVREKLLLTQEVYRVKGGPSPGIKCGVIAHSLLLPHILTENESMARLTGCRNELAITTKPA